MNERIRQLAKQAHIWVIDNTDYSPLSRIPPEFVEKFAELIVRECIDVHVDDYGVDIIGDVLKKHFGVEE